MNCTAETSGSKSYSCVAQKKEIEKNKNEIKGFLKKREPT